MRYAKIAPKVANVTCGRKTLTDKETAYPETQWRKGHFDELLRRGFLVLVEGSERTISNPADVIPVVKMIKKRLTKADIRNNPDLKEQGLKPGDEVEVPEEAAEDNSDKGNESHEEKQ